MSRGGGVCVRPGCLGGPGQAASGVPRRAGRAAGALRGHTHTGSAAPAAALPGGGRWEGDCNFNIFFFRTIRISVGNFCRRQRRGGGGRGRRAAWWGSPRAPLGPTLPLCPVPRSPGGHNTWAVQGPGRGCPARRGGVTPHPPAPGRGFCNAVGVVMHGAHRSPGPLQWQHRAGPLLAGSEGPRRAGPGCPAPLRSAPRWRHRASPPAGPGTGSQVLGSAARTLEPPDSPPSPLLAPRSAAWKCRCSARSVGKGE